MTLPDFWLRALAVMALDGFEIRTRDRHGEEHSAVRFTGGRAEMPAPLVSGTPARSPRAPQPQIVTGGTREARILSRTHCLLTRSGEAPHSGIRLRVRPTY